MASNIVNLMTNYQLSYLKEMYNMLMSVHLDKSKSYKIAAIDADGRHEYLVNREEHLEFIISSIVEELGEIFPHLDESISYLHKINT